MTAQSKDARAAILARLARATGDRRDPDAVAARLREPPCAPRPHMAAPAPAAELLARFVQAAEAAGAVVETLATSSELPPAVAAVLRRHRLPPDFWLPSPSSPPLDGLDWTTAHLRPRPAPPPCETDAVAALTPAVAGIAETGTCVFAAGEAHPAMAAFLPRVHVVVLPTARIVPGLDDAWVMLRDHVGAGRMPRTVNWVTGPSRTADIEQTLVEGAHGPAALHVLLVRED